MSSVCSSSRTSSTSSQVTRPSRRPSSATTAIDGRSYRCKVRATSSWSISGWTVAGGGSCRSATRSSSEARTRCRRLSAPSSRRPSSTTNSTWKSSSSARPCRRTSWTASRADRSSRRETRPVVMIPPALSSGYASRPRSRPARSSGRASSSARRGPGGSAPSRSVASSSAMLASAAAPCSTESEARIESGRHSGAISASAGPVVVAGASRNSSCRSSSLSSHARAARSLGCSSSTQRCRSSGSGLRRHARIAATSSANPFCPTPAVTVAPRFRRRQRPQTDHDSDGMARRRHGEMSARSGRNAVRPLSSGSAPAPGDHAPPRRSRRTPGRSRSATRRRHRSASATGGPGASVRPPPAPRPRRETPAIALPGCVTHGPRGRRGTRRPRWTARRDR